MGQMEAEERDAEARASESRRMEAAYFASLEFVRPATAADGAVYGEAGTLWRDVHGDDVWLNPKHVQQHGLTAKMREGLARGQGGAEPLDPEPNKPKLGELTGGHTDSWRWDFVVDGDDVTVCVDNKPAIQNTDATTERIPALEQARIPAEIVQAIAAMLP